MFHRRHLDPRLNPSLRPHEWAEAHRWSRIRLGLFGGLVAAALLTVAAYLWYPFDRTKGLQPAEIASRAGSAILAADSYRFSLDLTGTAVDGQFPAVEVKGEFQRKPELLHMAGQVQSDDVRVNVEYYQDGGDLYIKQPLKSGWYRLKDSTLDETAAFYPDNLAAPLLSGVRKAEFIGREHLAGGDTVELQLDLDPNVMLPYATALRSDKVEYLLWVYTRDLKPARMAMKVTPSPENQGRQTNFFSYTVDLELGRNPTWAVPTDVKTAAILLDEGSAPPQAPPTSEAP